MNNDISKLTYHCFENYNNKKDMPLENKLSPNHVVPLGPVDVPGGTHMVITK